MTPNTSLRFDTSLRDSYISLSRLRPQRLDVRELWHLKQTCASMRKDCTRIRELQIELRQSAEMLFETKVASKLEHLKVSGPITVIWLLHITVLITELFACVDR